MRIGLDLAQLVLAITLVVLILLQGKGNTASAFFNRESLTTYRTRRGIEKTLLRATIVIAVLLCVISLLNNLGPRYKWF